MLVFSIFCDFSLIHEVFINIRTPGSQFDNYILLHSYIALQKQSFDPFFCFLGLSVAKIHVHVVYRCITLLTALIRGCIEHSVILGDTNGH